MIKEEKFIPLSDGTKIYAQIKEIGSPIWLIGVHGIGEHLGRHQYLPQIFGGIYNIFLFDLRGHGRSQGKKAYVNHFEDFARDLNELLEFLKTVYKMKKYILFGHSMGALVASDFLQNVATSENYPIKAFFSAPPVGLPGALGHIFKLTPLNVLQGIANVSASVRLKGLVDLKYLSHDIRVQEDYLTDPWNNPKLHSKLLLEMVYGANRVFSRPLRLKCPAFCAVGSEDRIVDPNSIVSYFTQVEKTVLLKVIPGAYHEIHNEVEKYRAEYFTFLQDCLFH